MAIIQCSHCGHKFVRDSQREQCPLCGQTLTASTAPDPVSQASAEPAEPIGAEPQPDSAGETFELNEEERAAQEYVQALFCIFDTLLAANDWKDVHDVIESHLTHLLIAACPPTLTVLSSSLRQNEHPEVAEHVDMYRELVLDSLEHGFEAACVAGVVAALRQVNDRATYLLMTRFSELFLDRTLQLTPAEALAQAQRWLREEASYHVLASYKPPLLAFTVQRMSENQQKVLNTIRHHAAERARAHPDTLPYADPRFWAAFVVTGR